MSRLSEILKTSEPADVATIRAAVPLLSRFSDLEIYTLWDAFSHDYCASWLNVDKETLENFTSWVEG